MRSFYYFILIFISAACTSSEEKVINQVLEAHGSKLLNHSDVTFTYRGIDYSFTRDGGDFSYSRMQKDSIGNLIKDIYTNSGLLRSINDSTLLLPDTLAAKYSNSINSVAYFLFLPLALKDPAVNPILMDPISIMGQTYHTLKVTFSPEGGGKDFEDEYRFWIHKDKGTLDYFAYNYQTDGGGIRFREAINTRIIEGVRFSDYQNYGFENLEHNLDELPQLFEKGSIPLVSKIENENIRIKL